MQTILRTAIAGLFALLPAVSQAQDRFGDWVLVCQPEQPCQLVQQLSISETGALAARLIAVKVEDGAWLAAQVPLGVYLPGGAVFKVDTETDTPQQEMTWQRCLGDICEATIQIDPDRLAEIAEAERMLFAYRMTPQEEPRVMTLSLNGFVEGLEKTGPPTGAAAE